MVKSSKREGEVRRYAKILFLSFLSLSFSKRAKYHDGRRESLSSGSWPQCFLRRGFSNCDPDVGVLDVTDTDEEEDGKREGTAEEDGGREMKNV